MAKNLHFVVESLPGLGAAESLVDATVVTDADEGPESVFHLIHDIGQYALPPGKGRFFFISSGAFYTACKGGMISAFVLTTPSIKKRPTPPT